MFTDGPATGVVEAEDRAAQQAVAPARAPRACSSVVPSGIEASGFTVVAALCPAGEPPSVGRTTMIRQTLTAAAAFLAFASVGCAASSARQPAIDLPASERAAARAVADQFLSSLDQKHFEGAWAVLWHPIQTGLRRSDWEAAMVATRSLVGSIPRRELRSAEVTERLPDAPPGVYYVLEFTTVVENGSAAERVVLRMDREWRVAGYFLERDLPVPPQSSRPTSACT
jgi:hypothetical protein